MQNSTMLTIYSRKRLSKAAWVPHFLSFAVALLASTLAVRSAETNLPAPKVEQVAPGIWRIHFGQPEPFTPTHFRSGEVDTIGLKAMPLSHSMPLDPSKISFHVSRRGSSVLLPMDPRENIYGLGLSTTLFDMTIGKNGGQTGRRVFVIPTDKPENDLGESHAPVPFYVSSRGYGVFVDTARFASFYTGMFLPSSGAAEADDNGGGAQTSTTELYRARSSTRENNARGCAGGARSWMSMCLPGRRCSTR